MLILYKYYLQVKMDIWAGGSFCQSCNSNQSYHYCRRRISVYLFYILPIFAITTGYFAICDNCGIMVKINPFAYYLGVIQNSRPSKVIHYPVEILIADGDPKELRLGWSLYNFILSLLWLALMADVCIDTLNEGYPYFWIYILLGCFPFIRCSVDMLLLLIKRYAYKKAIGY